MPIQAECPCGAIALRIDGSPRKQLYCHCRDCQVVHGASSVPVALFLTEHVRVVRGAPQRWIYKTTPRYFCSDCGSRLYAEPNPLVTGVIATLLDSPFEPTAHIHCGPSGHVRPDGLPHYVDLPQELGGSGRVLSP